MPVPIAGEQLEPERFTSAGTLMAADIAVVIPTFRRNREVVEAVLSALQQEGVSVEIVVVDDCPDGSAQRAIEAIGNPQVCYVRNPQPSGGRPGQVRNIGWPLTRAPLIHFLDDDDHVPPGHYAQVCQAFSQRPGVGVVFGHVEPFGMVDTQVAQESTYFRKAAQRSRDSGRFGSKWAFAANMYFGSTLLVCGAALIRRPCVEALEGFNPELRLMEDVDFYARAIRRFGAHFCDRESLRYRIGPSLMHRPDIQPLVDESYERIHADYRKQWGHLNFLALKMFARGILRVN